MASKRESIFCRLIVAMLLGNFAVESGASEIITPGSPSKITSGLGSTSRDSSSVVFNPANLPDAQVLLPTANASWTRLDYTYKKLATQTSEARMSTSIPQFEGGVTWGASKRLAVGAHFYPTGIGLMESRSVPYELVAGLSAPVHFSMTEGGLRTGVGVAYRATAQLSLGASALISKESRDYEISEPGRESTPSFSSKSSAQYFQAVLGARGEWFHRTLVTSFSVRSPAAYPYSGSQTTHYISNATATPLSGESGYAPLVGILGIELFADDLRYFGEISQEAWSAGRQARQALPNQAAETDFVDVLDIGFGIEFTFANRGQLSLSVSRRSANVGDGQRSTVISADPNALDGTNGVTLGDPNAIPRTVIAAGYRITVQTVGYLHFGYQSSSGTREVPEGAPGAGNYTLATGMVTAGFAYPLQKNISAEPPAVEKTKPPRAREEPN